jgi:multidrug efflux pump subunit AcrB
MLIAILGGSHHNMPVDIFPYIDIPVVSVVLNYSGLSPEEMEKRMINSFERSMTTSVNDIAHSNRRPTAV